jgi:hypothetical protein
MANVTFIVGSAADAFDADFARAVAEQLRTRYAYAEKAGEESYRSDPVNVKGWRELQTLMRNMIGPTAAPHFTDVDAYQTVYVPADIARVESIPIENAADPLHVASLPALIRELTTFAETAQLPTDEVKLMELAAEYLEAEEDRELDFQTYVQLMMSAKQAAARGQALFVSV